MARKKKIDLVNVGPDTPAGRFIRRFWQPVCVASELKPGWTKRLHVLDEHFTLYRGESKDGEAGQVHLVADRCPHRNASLHVGWVEGETIRCFYHGWKFDGAGACLEMPAEKDSFVRKMKIRSYPVREYLGLIFAYFGEGEPPEFARFPELEEDNGYPLSNSRWELPHNYFQRMENDLDEAHVNFVHKTQASLAAELDVLPQFDAEETDYGILRIGTRQRGGRKDVRYSHMLMPNTTLIVVPPSTKEDNWAVHLAWRVPVTADRTISLVASRRKIHAPEKEAPAWPPVAHYVKEILEGRMRMRDVDPAHPLLFNIQDNVVLLAQGAVYDDRDTERLGQSDAAVILLRKLYERELKAMMEGKAAKEWRRPREKLQLGFHSADEG